ncbi:MAG: glycosyltransferase family 4 protein [Candidatus Moranbacteria bacterium]|nr:glycosyltransferase family 4 protein [Candidatus Moranbacteria bacterium]
MKLLIFSPYYPPHRGGLESHSDEFNKHFSEKGASITVFTPRLPLTAPSSEVMHTRVRVIRYPAVEIIHNYPIPLFWKKDFWKLWKNLSLGNYSLVISRTRFFFPSLMAGYFAWKKHIHWVHIEHGSDFAQFENASKNLLGKIYDYTLGRLILKHAKLVIANSEASRKFVIKLSGRTDCEVVYRGVEKDLILSASPIKELKEVHPNTTLIGYIGRLIEGKGVHDLIQAFAEAEIPKALLVIIGDGPEKARLEELSRKLTIESRVLFLGAQPLPVAMGYLKVFDIFVNPSYTEGIPTSVIEAALLKKAIIATDVGGTNEIISGHKDGILIEARDIEALKKNLLSLSLNPELIQEYGLEAEKRVSSLFIWNKAIEKYQALFTKILS